MAKKHKCPICGQDTTNDKYRPFCSKRCADIDLGRWFSGTYAFKAEEVDEQDYEELEAALSTEAPKNLPFED